jgi:hypothetical protein
MPLSGEALNEQGNAITRGTKPTNEATWVTIATDTSQSPEASAIGKKIKKTAHGLLTGEIIVFTKLNAAAVLGEVVGALVVGVPYYVFKIGVNEFGVAYTKAQAEAGEGSCIEFTVELKAESVLKKIEEHTGAKTKRQKAVFAAAANLTNEDATAREIEATTEVKVRWVMFWSAETVGVFMGLEAVTEKTLAIADIYKITNNKISQNAYIA